MNTDLPEDTIFQEIWTRAFKSYQEQTGRKLQNDSIVRKLRSTEDLLKEIDSRKNAFENFRSHHGRLWSALSSCLKPVDLLGETLQDAVSSAPFAPAVFAGVLHLVTACNDVSDSYDYLEKLFLELEEYMERLEEYLKGGMSTSLKKKSIVTLSLLLEIIGLSEKMIKTGRFRQFLGATVFGNEKMKSALERLKSQIDSEERLVNAATYASTQQTAQVTGRTEKKVEILAKSIEEMRTFQNITREEEKKEAEDKIIRNLLYSPAIDKIRDIYFEMNISIVAGSGKWIEDEHLFDAWVEREVPTLWIFGGPGTGKSFLATRIISDLRIRYPQDVEHPSPISVAYFYVKEDDQHLQDLNVILKSIAYQTTFVDPIYRKHVLSIHSSDESLNSPRSTWENLFIKFFGSKSNFEHSAFIIIDGLDEAPLQTRRELLELIRPVADHASGITHPRIQFAVLGRPDLREDIRFSRREKSIVISSQKNHDDIAKYIHESLKKVKILYRMNTPTAKKFAKQIHDSILQGSDGMFLWAKLVLAQIYEKERKSEILEALDNAPRELGEMVHHVFERLEKDPYVNHHDLNKILAWVTCMRRPLLLGELDVILRIPSGEANLALRDRLRGKLASILTLARLEGYEEVIGEPEYDVTERSLNMDFLSFDDSDDSVAIDDDVDVDVDEDESTTNNDDGLLSDARLQMEFGTTQVVFGHKRIKDYIVQSNFRFSPSNPLAIGVDIHKSEVEITVTLLSIICDGITKDYKPFGLASYAAGNFMKHLEAIDMSCTTGPDKQMMLKLLYRLFHEEECLRALLEAAEEPDGGRMSDGGYNEFFHIWIATSQYTQVIRRWFCAVDEIEVSIFEPSQLEWIRKAGLSAKDLLRPLALLSANLWLTNTMPDYQGFLEYGTRKGQFRVWLLQGYFNMDEEGETSDFLSDSWLFEIGLDRILPEEMKQLAEFGNIEKTEYWHTGLGWIMMDGSHFEPAMEHFHSALELNPTHWMAMHGLAQCLGSLDCYEEAIFRMNEALKFLPSSLQFLADHFWIEISNWKLELGDVDGGIEAAKNAYVLDTDDVYSTFDYISTLHRVRRPQPIIDFIKDISQRQSSDFTKSSLTELISIGSIGWNISEYVGLAAVMADSEETLETMRDIIDIVVSEADSDSRDKWTSVLVRIFGANFNYRYLNRVDVAMELWEAALRIITSNFNDPLRHNSVSERSTCAEKLSELYFSKAVEAKKAGEDSGPWIKKLRGLTKLTKTLENSRDFAMTYGIGYPSELYGIWLREYDHVKESVWKDCFRPAILQGIELLSDEDPNNDQLGYASLAMTLLHAGDIIGGTSALRIILNPLEKSLSKSFQQQELTEGETKSSTQETEVTSVSNDHSKQGTTSGVLPRVKLSSFNDKSWGCDGPCTTDRREYHELHFCRICNGVCFCEECIHLIKSNKLPYRRCSPDHEWIQAYPISKDTHDFAAAVIRDGYVEINQEWLKKLREEWEK